MWMRIYIGFNFPHIIRHGRKTTQMMNMIKDYYCRKKGLKHSFFGTFLQNIPSLLWLLLAARRFPAYPLFMSTIQQRRQWLSLLCLLFCAFLLNQSNEKVVVVLQYYTGSRYQVFKSYEAISSVNWPWTCSKWIRG